MEHLSDISFELSRDNYMIVNVRINDKHKYIGSKYNMKASIDKFMEKIQDISCKIIFIIFGLGTGEHIKAIREKYSDNKIIVFEPNIKLIEKVREVKELRWIFNDEKILIEEYTNDNFNYVLTKKTYQEDYRYMRVYPCFSYETLYSAQYLELMKSFKKITLNKVMGVNTKLLFNELWFECFIKNYKEMSNSLTVNSLVGKYKNKPAIIVSAGPSLDENIKYLKGIDDQMYIFCGGRNIKALYNEGIEPHLVGVVDPGEESFKLVEDYIESCNSPLLFYEGSNSKVVNLHKGNKVLFTQSDIVRDIFGCDILDLTTGGSVANIITQFAVKIGCNPIIFIGQDLAYPDNKAHAENCVRSGISPKIDETKKELIEVLQYGGNDYVKTDYVLDSFRNSMEDIIKKNTDVTFINCSEGGARINGTIEMNLEDAIEKFKGEVEKIEFTSDLKRVSLFEERFIDFFDFQLKEAEKLIRLSKTALNNMHNFQNSYINNRNNEFDKINKKIKELDFEISEIYKDNILLKKIFYSISLWLNNIQKDDVRDYKTRKEYIESVVEKKNIFYNQIIERCEKVIITIKNNI